LGVTKIFYNFEKQELDCTEKELLWSVAGTTKSRKYVMN